MMTTRRERRLLGHDELFLDLADARSFVFPDRIDIAYLIAGLTNLDTCAGSLQIAQLINVENTLLLARELIRRGTFVVFFSSACVFDGEKPLYRTKDRCSPQTVYGRHKAEVERELLPAGDQVSVVRLSKVIFPTTPIIQRWLTELSSDRPIKPYDDLQVAPVSASVVVDVVKRVAKRRHSGIVHVSANRQISYTEMASHIMKRIGKPSTLLRPTTSLADDRRLEHIPKFVTLDTAETESALGLSTPSLIEMLDTALGFRP